jgi:hypothetical protein
MILVHGVLHWCRMTPRRHITTLFISWDDGLIKSNTWMSEPMNNLAKIHFKQSQKKQKEKVKKEREEEECANNQQMAHNQEFCCYNMQRE